MRSTTDTKEEKKEEEEKEEEEKEEEEKEEEEKEEAKLKSRDARPYGRHLKTYILLVS